MDPRMTPIPALVSIAMLVLATIVPWSWYHGVLRLVVSGSAAYMAYRAHESGTEPWAWTMIATVILYNPLAPVYLDGLQPVVDLAAAALIATLLWRLGWRPGARTRRPVRWRI